MNANIMNTQIFNKMKFDLKSQLRSHKFIFTFENKPFLYKIFILNLILLKLYMNAKIMNMQIFNKMKFDLKGH